MQLLPKMKNYRFFQAERDWNSWDDSPRTVDEHIEHYRQRLAQPKDEENKEPALDFFQVSRKQFHCIVDSGWNTNNSILLQDMEPKVVKQQKVFINTNKTKSNNDDNNFSRLQASSATDFAIKQTSELEDWSDHDDEDATQTGWDEINDDAAKEMIRQKRREQRAQRNQRVQQQKLNKMQSQAGYSYHA